MTTTKKSPAKKAPPAKANGAATSKHRTGVRMTGGRAPEKKDQIVAMLRRGATAAEITEAVGCGQAMTYKTIAEMRDSIRVVGVKGTSRVLQLVDREPFPFQVGEYVRVTARRISPIGEDVVVLSGGIDGDVEYEVIVP